MLAATACNGGGAQTVTSAATSVPAATSAATSVPAATSAPTSAPAAPTSEPASHDITLTIDTSTSQASYHARETLVGRSFPTDAIGTSKAVSGSVVLGPGNTVNADQSGISVDLSQLQSDESRRDNLIKRQTIDTSRYPMAMFVPKQVEGLPDPLPTSGQATFQMSGDLTVHGVSKPVTWDVTARFAPSSVTGNATTSVKITDFGMTPPRVGPVLSIEDGLTLVLDFTAARGA
jgi:polyisoprenoid-binding protein YceI